MSIESELSKIKSWYWQNWPLCLFCNHRIRKREDGDLAHIIRRSQRSQIYSQDELVTMKLNTGLAHRACHEIFDNNPDQAVYLPRFVEVHFLMWLIDPDIFYQLQFNVYRHFDFPDFAKMADKYSLRLEDFEHHGQLWIFPEM